MPSELRNSLIVPAALAGVAVGATVVTLEFSVLFFSEPEQPSQFWILPAFWIGALIVFLMGFVFFGVPAWFAAHAFNRHHWYDAVLIGGVLTGGVEFLWSLLTEAGWFNAVKTAAAIGLGGAASGLTIWWIVYRKQ